MTQLRQEIVELVKDPAGADISGVHYLPHHTVIRRDKMTMKLRVVYDASDKTNEYLYISPKFDQNFSNILSHFRIHQIAVTADIKQALISYDFRGVKRLKISPLFLGR